MYTVATKNELSRCGEFLLKGLQELKTELDSKIAKLGESVKITKNDIKPEFLIKLEKNVNFEKINFSKILKQKEANSPVKMKEDLLNFSHNFGATLLDVTDLNIDNIHDQTAQTEKRLIGAEEALEDVLELQDESNDDLLSSLIMEDSPPVHVYSSTTF